MKLDLAGSAPKSSNQVARLVYDHSPPFLSSLMVKPRAFAKFLFKKYKATVIDDIWPELIFFSGVAVSESHF